MSNWWSTTSQVRILRRIIKLETKLQKAESEWKFTPAGWLIRQGLRQQLTVIANGFHVILGVLLLILSAYYKVVILSLPSSISHPVAWVWLLGTIIFAGLAANFYYVLLGHSRYMCL